MPHNVRENASYSRTLHDLKYFAGGQFRADYDRAVGKNRQKLSNEDKWGSGKVNFNNVFFNHHKDIYFKMRNLGQRGLQNAIRSPGTHGNHTPQDEFYVVAKSIDAGYTTIHRRVGSPKKGNVINEDTGVPIPQDIIDEYKRLKAGYLNQEGVAHKQAIYDNKIDKYITDITRMAAKLSYSTGAVQPADRMHYYYNNNLSRQLRDKIDAMQRYLLVSTNRSPEAVAALNDFVSKYQKHIAVIENIALSEGDKQIVDRMQDEVEARRKALRDGTVPKSERSKYRKELHALERARADRIFQYRDFNPNHPGSPYRIDATFEGHRHGVNHGNRDLVGDWYDVHSIDYHRNLTPSSIITNSTSPAPVSPSNRTPPATPSGVLTGQELARTMHASSTRRGSRGTSSEGTAGESLARYINSGEYLEGMPVEDFIYSDNLTNPGNWRASEFMTNPQAAMASAVEQQVISGERNGAIQHAQEVREARAARRASAAAAIAASTTGAPFDPSVFQAVMNPYSRTGDDIAGHRVDRDKFRNDELMAEGISGHFQSMRRLAENGLAPSSWLLPDVVKYYDAANKEYKRVTRPGLMAGYDPSTIINNMNMYDESKKGTVKERQKKTWAKKMGLDFRTPSEAMRINMEEAKNMAGMMELFGMGAPLPQNAKRTYRERLSTWYKDYFDPHLEPNGTPRLLSENGSDYLRDRSSQMFKSLSAIGKTLPLVAKPLNVLAKALGKMAAAAGHAGSAFFGGASALLGNPLDASTLDAVAGMGGAIGGMSGAGISAFGGMISGAGGALGKFSEGGSGEAVSGAPGGGKLGKLAGAAGAVGAGMQIAGGFISAAGGAVTSGWNTAVNLLKSINKATLKIMSTSPLFETIKNILNLAFTMVFLPAMTMLEDKMMPTFLNLLDWAVDFGGKFADEFEQYIDPITELFENAISNFTGWMSDHIGDIAEMVAGMVSLLPSMMEMTFGLLEIFVKDKDLIINLCKYTIQTMEKVMSENLIGSLLKMARYGVDFIDVYGESLGRFMADATSLLIKITEYLSPILWIIKGLYALVDGTQKLVDWIWPFADGGYVGPQVGGTQMLINGVPSVVAEAGEGEFMIPESKMSMLNGGVTINFTGNVYGMSDFKQQVRSIMNEYNTKGAYR